jgi:hypothetical protein
MVPYLAAGVFGLAAVALLIAGFFEMRKALRLTRAGAHTRATVREMKKSVLQHRDDDGLVRNDAVYAPVFEFQSADGKVHRVEGDASNPPRHQVGDEVSLLYDPAAPEGARLESFSGLWLFAALFGIGGGVVLAVALVILWMARSG